MVSSITEVAWLSLEPQSGSHVDFYEAAVSERLEEAYQGLVSAEPGTAIPVNCALGETFVVPGAVVSMVRHDPTPKEARTAYHPHRWRRRPCSRKQTGYQLLREALL